MKSFPRTWIASSLSTLALTPVLSCAELAASNSELLEEVLVVSPSAPVSRFDSNFTVSRISEEAIRQRAYRSIPQALRDVPGILVQETAYGQGSPYIRGFTGFRNVFLIDGIKLNNSVFREGPNQYWATVDAASVSQLEVISGPSSVLYGSDAIGGAVYAVTGSKFHTGLKSYTRLSSAEESITQRFDLGFRADDGTAVKIGATGKDYDDVRGGADVGRQESTGYTEWAGDIKVVTQLDNWQLDLFHQQLRQNNVPRTHRTQAAIDWENLSIGSDQKRELDQHRSLSYVKASSRALGFADSVSLTASYSETEQSRDRVRSNGNRELEGFDVATTGLQAKMSKQTQLGKLTFGADYYRDNVDSFSSRNTIQGPVADDATYTTFDVYVYDEYSLDRLDINGGVRYSSADADANNVRDPVTGSRISIDDSWSDVVANIGFGYALIPEKLRTYVSAGQGFRTPNLADLTHFDTARTNEFEVPVPGLEPEKYISYEWGLKFKGKRSEMQVSIYYTDVEDMIIRFPTGNVIDGEFEITRDNIGTGWVSGIELQGRFSLTDQLLLSSRLAWMDSEISTFPTSNPVLVDEPVDREMPFTSSLTLRYVANESMWLETVVDYAAKADDLSTRDMSDTSRIPPGGTPSYAVWHVRGGYTVSEDITLNLSVDNLLNEDYRVHGSGYNMPGRNLILGISFSL